MEAPKGYRFIKFKEGYAITDNYTVIYYKKIKEKKEAEIVKIWKALDVESYEFSAEDKLCSVSGNMKLKVDAIDEKSEKVKVFINSKGLKLNEIFIKSASEEVSLFSSAFKVDSDNYFDEFISSYIVRKFIVLFKNKHFDIYCKEGMLFFNSNEIDMYFSHMLKSDNEADVKENKTELKEEVKKEPINISELLEKIAKDRTVKI